MTYSRFEDLPVWQAAMDMALGVDSLVKDRAFRRPGDLADQLCRASLSVSNNIAEGFERGTTNELLAFLYISRGSAGETRSMLRFCSRHPDFAHLKSEISNLTSLSESCSRQIRAWADTLQNSDIAGPRRLNNHTRAAYDSTRRAKKFMQYLREVTDNARVGKPPPQFPAQLSTPAAPKSEI